MLLVMEAGSWRGSGRSGGAAVAARQDPQNANQSASGRWIVFLLTQMNGNSGTILSTVACANQIESLSRCAGLGLRVTLGKRTKRTERTQKRLFKIDCPARARP